MICVFPSFLLESYKSYGVHSEVNLSPTLTIVYLINFVSICIDHQCYNCFLSLMIFEKFNMIQRHKLPALTVSALFCPQYDNRI